MTELDLFSSYLFFVLALMTGFLSPGPNILSIVATAMSSGRGPALRMAGGVATGTSVWASLAVGGLTGLLAAHATLFLAVKIAGAAYLFWLAYKAFRSAARGGAAPPFRGGKGVGARNPFCAGLAVQLSNPKAALHWTAIAAIALSPEAPLWFSLLLVLSAMIISFLGHGLYAAAFSTRRVGDVYARLRRWIEATLGAFYALLGLKLLSATR